MFHEEDWIKKIILLYILLDNRLKLCFNLMETKDGRKKKRDIRLRRDREFFFDIGYRRIRETHGSTDGTFGVHGEKDQADA